MLYPTESETREVKDLSGIWNFKIDADDEGFTKEWYSGPLEGSIDMPVPSSYNDITQDLSIRDHIGYVWYERIFYVSEIWKSKRALLRVGSASHSAVLWVNGVKVAEHKGGFLPFEADITAVLMYGRENRVCIAVNNTLDWTTLPPGLMKTFDDDMHPHGYKYQDYFHDFYNYSGIHRPVRLSFVPQNYISNITVVTKINGKDGLVSYSIIIEGQKRNIGVKLIDEDGVQVAECTGGIGEMAVKDARLWEPGNAYLYKLEVSSYADGGILEDCYRLPVGIRTVKADEKNIYINGKPFYFKGFGKHEDSDIKGKGLDNVINLKDFNLLKWIGANSFRTSHYPYSEEMMDLADKNGIVVLDEMPAVGMNNLHSHFEGKVFTEGRIDDRTLEHHLQVMNELIDRDKNHPCVVMWVVANEAATIEDGAVSYFKKVADETRKKDPTRLVAIVECLEPDKCLVDKYFDVIGVNRYYSWYTDCGHLEVIEHQLECDLNKWFSINRKPIIVTEYGADTINGFHSDPPVMYSEEYQCKMLEHFHNVFDRLDFIVGEHVWNFADFAAPQEVRRIMGNRKGIFTRQRQPKAAAFVLRKRWLSLKKGGIL